jgi:hypothetical protein
LTTWLLLTFINFLVPSDIGKEGDLANDLGCQDFAGAWVQQLELTQCWNPQIVCAQVEEHIQESKNQIYFCTKCQKW